MCGNFTFLLLRMNVARHPDADLALQRKEQHGVQPVGRDETERPTALSLNHFASF